VGLTKTVHSTPFCEDPLQKFCYQWGRLLILTTKHWHFWYHGRYGHHSVFNDVWQCFHTSCFLEDRSCPAKIEQQRRGRSSKYYWRKLKLYFDIHDKLNLTINKCVIMYYAEIFNNALINNYFGPKLKEIIHVTQYTLLWCIM